MKLNHKLKLGAAGVISLALVAAGASAASAAVQANGSDAPLYLYDTSGILVTDPSIVYPWEADSYGSGGATSYDEATLCPPASTGTNNFLSPVGSERTVLSWNAYSTGGFNPNPAVAGTHEVLAANLTPNTFINGNARGAQAAGGNYSIGIACTINSGVTVVAAFYRTIAMTPVSGDYTVTALDAVGVPEEPEVPVDPSTQGTVALAPTITGAVNGVLSLNVPVGAAATFGTPSLVNNKSTTTGTLGAVTVNDGRVLTVNGWELSANVADFVSSADATNTIGKTQLGFAPTITAAGTTATGITAAAAQVAGSASYPAMFASAAAGNTVGASVLDAGLTFVAPQAKAAGTYKSTMTLTVVSK